MAAYKKRILDRVPPDGIKVQRNGSDVKISVPVQISGWNMRSQANKVTTVVMLAVTVASGFLVWLILPESEFAWQVSCVWMVVVLFALHHFFTEPNPFLRLQAGVLESYLPPLFPVSPKVPTSEIKQLYVTTNQVQDERGTSDQHSLFVLRKNGVRERIFGDFLSIYAALFVEELLEIG